MKKAILVILILLTPPTIFADGPYTNFDEFTEMVRQMTRLSDTDFLPDSTLHDLCAQSIVFVSTELGGYETRLRFTTSSGSKFYELGDTITEIVHATVLTSSGETKSIRAWWPEYYEEFGLPRLDDNNQGGVPVAYFHWDDSVQIMPEPVRVDTIYFYCNTEHPYPTTADANDSILFNKTTYSEAALSYAAFKCLAAVKDYNASAVWKGIYDGQVQALRASFARKIQRGTTE